MSLSDPSRRRSSLELAGVMDPANRSNKRLSSPELKPVITTARDSVNFGTPSSHRGSKVRDEAGPSGQQRNSMQFSMNPTTKPHHSPNRSSWQADPRPPKKELDDLMREFKIRRDEMKHEGSRGSVPFAAYPTPPGVLHEENMAPRSTRDSSCWPNNVNEDNSIANWLVSKVTGNSSRRSSTRYSSVSTSATARMTSPVDATRYEWARRGAAKNDRILKKLNHNFFGPGQDLSSAVDGRKSQVRFSGETPIITEGPIILAPPPSRWKSMMCCCKRKEKAPEIQLKRNSILKSNSSGGTV